MPTFHRVRTLGLSGLAVALAAVALGSSAGRPAATAGAHTHAEVVYITNFEDPRRLVGSVENVFVGRVLAQVSTTILDGEPETQFQVEVQENIKGSLSGKVIVNQEGGRDGDRLILVEDDALLRPGQVYLFATLPFRERGWHTLVPVYGDLPIADASQRAALVSKFKKATQEQIPYKPS
jgi:hypothetical protein